MPKSIPVVMKKSLLATAIVVSLSACSSAPKDDGFGLSSVGNGLVKAGKVTADVSRKTWNKTTYLLGFTDSPDGRDSKEVDEQLLIADNTGNTGSTGKLEIPSGDMPAILSKDSNRPVLVQQATASADSDTLQLGTPDLSSEDLSAVDVARVSGPSNSGNALPAQVDYVHTVAASETLWDIAKTTTGNANNWHVLADVNNLNQSATVFPGQELIVPGNLAKPEYKATGVVATAKADEPAMVAEAQATTFAENQKLTIPAPEVALMQPSTESVGAIASNNQYAKSFEIQPSETLWDFAKRTTGDATNWKAIASHNKFTEKEAVTVRPGQTVFVPRQLVADYPPAVEDAAVSTSAAIEPAKAPVKAAVEALVEAPVVAPIENATTTVAVAAPTESPTAKQVIASSLPTLEERRAMRDQMAKLTAEASNSVSMADETQDIKIVEATYKSTDPLAPVTAQSEPAAIIENANIPAQVTVSGTYYPKAVYNNADFSSSLLMRVSPGTTLQVSKAMGNWFEVETDNGVGYVHQRDIK